MQTKSIDLLIHISNSLPTQQKSSFEICFIKYLAAS